MSNRNRKGESVLRFYIFKVLLNVIRRKKRGKREREEEEEEGRQKRKKTKKIPKKINSWGKVGSNKNYLSLLRKSSRLVYS